MIIVPILGDVKYVSIIMIWFRMTIDNSFYEKLMTFYVNLIINGLEKTIVYI